MSEVLKTGWYFATWTPREGKPERHMVYYNSKYPNIVYAMLTSDHVVPEIDLRNIKHDRYTNFILVKDELGTIDSDDRTSQQ